MRARKLDNFKKWRDKQKRLGNIKSEYPPLIQNGNLAELIGVILGDGHIYRHDRCDSLRITGNYSNKGFTNRYAKLTYDVFGRVPAIAKVKASNAVTITIYEKSISSRLKIPHGNRSELDYKVPSWIRENRMLTIRFLRGLYEAEGCITHHEKTSTHKFIFSNRNPKLLDIVFMLVSELGFHPHCSRYAIQVSRKAEVQKLSDLLQFRHYSS